MGKNVKPIYLDANTVSANLGITKQQAYKVIRELNKELKEKYPGSLIFAGKINRFWFEDKVDYKKNA